MLQYVIVFAFSQTTCHRHLLNGRAVTTPRMIYCDNRRSFWRRNARRQHRQWGWHDQVINGSQSQRTGVIYQTTSQLVSFQVAVMFLVIATKVCYSSVWLHQSDYCTCAPGLLMRPQKDEAEARVWGRGRGQKFSVRLRPEHTRPRPRPVSNVLYETYKYISLSYYHKKS